MTIAQPIRDWLATQDGERTAGEISKATGLTPTLVSGALAGMIRAGILTKTPVKYRAKYKLAREVMSMAERDRLAREAVAAIVAARRAANPKPAGKPVFRNGRALRLVSVTKDTPAEVFEEMLTSNDFVAAGGIIEVLPTYWNQPMGKCA